LEKFREMIAARGSEARVVDEPMRLPHIDV
jgi:thymidine phosphorylase